MTKSTCARSLGLLCALALVVLCGCATTGINRGQINIITSDEEVRLGQDLSVEVTRQVEIYNNDAVTSYVQMVGNRIVQHCDRKDISYHFTVVKKDEVNAFALPGGYIYVYTGLMKDIDDEAQLASVLAHEVGHVAARHATERLTAMYGYEFVVSVALGESPKSYSVLIAQIFSRGGFLAYGRANEYEADMLGAQYVCAAGYDPNGMVELLRKLKGLESREPTKFETWLTTHPPTSERLAKMETYLAGIPKPQLPVRNAASYAKIKALLPN